ncbi:tRNA (guanosine(37)-N1)-methyltransferase TrmD [Candidatus Saccharibacteria bacterium]|nr:tRNA (guanosine(37)-N1)-methyltransferase TrmD [Candidatus Saccharibacteria bacterium]
MKIFTVISLFPEMFVQVFNTSMLWKAQDKNLAKFNLLNLRDFGLGPRHQVDDAPYGGGDGMLLMCEPIYKAVEEAKSITPNAKVVLMTPRGKIWQQFNAQEHAMAEDNYIIICPHYEGYDERILKIVDEQICVGKYILTGGEIPAMSIIDSIVRLIPGVLGGETSAEIESFSDGDNLEYPQYTRPEIYDNQKVPDVLLSGHHGNIAKWRADHSSKAK